jgi:hypothetical protein
LEFIVAFNKLKWEIVERVNQKIVSCEWVTRTRSPIKIRKTKWRINLIIKNRIFINQWTRRTDSKAIKWYLISWYL